MVCRHETAGHVLDTTNIYLPAVEEASTRQAVARDEAGEGDGDWIMPDVTDCCKVCLGFIPRPMGSD